MTKIKEKKKMGLTTRIFTALLAGVVLGVVLCYFLPDGKIKNDIIIEGILYVIGQGFIRLMKMLVVPLVFCSLICGSMAIGDTKNEINVKLTELGRKAYEAQKNGSISDADGLVYEIDELYEILKSQEAKLASLKKQKVCAACGTLCEIEAAYCSKCGEKFPERPAEEQEEDAAPEDDEAEVVETVLTAEE